MVPNDNSPEQDAAKMLLNEGIEVKIGKRTYKIKEISLGMLDAISALRLQMDIDENSMEKDPIAENNRSIHANAKLAAQVVAIGVLGWGSLKRRLLKRILARRLYERLTPATLFESVVAIIKLSNAADFTNSIRLMSGMKITAPNPDPNLVETT